MTEEMKYIVADIQVDGQAVFMRRTDGVNTSDFAS